MIENALVFALGALTAGILALIIFPAFTRRAARLARKSAEARLPRSMAELAAAKDAVRAEFAARTARIEYDYAAARKALVDERLARAHDQTRLSNLVIEKREYESTLAAAEARADAVRGELRAREEALAQLAADHRTLERELVTERARTRDAEARADEAERLATEMRAALIAAEAEGIAIAENRYRLAALAGGDATLAALPDTASLDLGDWPFPGTTGLETAVPPEGQAADGDEAAAPGNPATKGSDRREPPLFAVSATMLTPRSASADTAFDADRLLPDVIAAEKADKAEKSDKAGNDAGEGLADPVTFPPLPVPAVSDEPPIDPEDHARRVDDLARRLRSLRARNGASRGKRPAERPAEEAAPPATTKKGEKAEAKRREPVTSGE